VKNCGFDVNRIGKSEKLCLDLISTILNENYDSQKTWGWLKTEAGNNMYCDGYFANNNIVVEYMGYQHKEVVMHWGAEKGLKERIKRDKTKKDLVINHGIKYIAIWYDENWMDTEHIGNRIREVINHA